VKERILQLLNYLNLTATRFADKIGVQRSGISHILSGRNQPSYDFIQKTAKRFPEISLEWLLTGNGTIKKEDNPFNNLKKGQTIHDTEVIGQSGQPMSQLKINLNSVESDKENKKVTNVNTITRVIMFFSDGTFKAYEPERQD